MVMAAVKSSNDSKFVFQALILAGIYVLAFVIRLFSVIRYESIIHEFDPWFNFRATKYLVKEGFFAFGDWFDESTWYPLGRWIGNTVYPGLMWTSALLFKILHAWNLPVDIRNVSVFLAPFMASNTALVGYFIGKEAWTSDAGLFIAAFLAITPGYISRSVAGSYDNEAVAIFAMLLCFLFWIKAVKTGSAMWSGICALSYFYMVASWGGYIFIINLIPFHVLVLIACGRYSSRLYVAYSCWYPLATLLSMTIGFVRFQPVSSPEHAGAFGVFLLLQAAALFLYLQENLPKKQFRYVLWVIALVALAGVGVLVLLASLGYIPFLTSRFKMLVGSTSNIAIVNSVSEHQPTAWGTFFLDMHVTLVLTVPGMYFCFKSLSDANIFLLLYLVFISYFSSIMVRLMLVISPITCIIGGIGLSEILLDLFRPRKNTLPYEFLFKLPIVLTLASFCFLYVIHCSWVSSVAHSSPNIILSSQRPDGSRHIFDDYREAYHWLNHNTAPDSKIMSWWDYGYQITGIGNRTTIVDNNTRNNTHIATVGKALASREDVSIQVARMLDVDYVLVVFGGMIGYSSDDINKFLWMVRIGGGTFPEIKEREYMSPSSGYYSVGPDASSTMLNSLMYSLCYYRFGEIQSHYGAPAGYDRVRNYEIGKKDIKLEHFEEAFTSENWIIRIYRVKDRPNF